MQPLPFARGFALVFCSCVGFLAVSEANADANNVAFPKDWASGVMYSTVDRTFGGVPQYREHYIPKQVIEALRSGKPMPSGTVLTVVRFRAKLDPQGNPLKDANGRYIKGEPFGFEIMEKHTGWGKDYPAEIRNGEWEYRRFTADLKPDDSKPYTGCFQCHKAQGERDFVFPLTQQSQ